MKKRYSLIMLLGALTGMRTVLASDLSEFDFRHGYDVGLSVQTIDGSFTLGSRKYDWDSAQRYQLNFGAKALSFDSGARAIGYVSGYGFYENRSFDTDGDGEIEADVFGAGTDLGLLWLPFGDNRRATFGFFPYGSFGISWQSLAFRRVPVGGVPDPVTQDVSETRFEFGVGLDARLEIGRRLALTFGPGWRWWSSAEIVGNGTIAVPGGSVAFHGSELFLRGGFALTF